MRLYNRIHRRVKAIFSRIIRICRATHCYLNNFVDQERDPEYLSAKSILSKQEAELVELRREVTNAIDSQKLLQRQYEEFQANENEWQRRLPLDCQQRHEEQASELLSQYQHYADTTLEWKAKLEEQTLRVDSLKRELISKQCKVSEAEIRVHMLKAKAQALRANEKLTRSIKRDKIQSSRYSNRFRKVDKVLTSKYVKARMLKARSEASKEQRTLDQLEDKMLSNYNEYLIDMQEDLVILRQACARAIATLKRAQQQYNQSQIEENIWQQRVQQLRQEGDVALISEALIQQQHYTDTVLELKAKIEKLTTQASCLKHNLISLELKIVEIKIEKDIHTTCKFRERFSERQQNIVELRQTVDQAVDAKKRMQKSYEHSQKTADTLYQSAQQALQENDEALAREYLRQHKSCSENATKLKAEFNELSFFLNSLQDNLREIESN